LPPIEERFAYGFNGAAPGGSALALFRVKKPNAIVTGDIYSHDGEQRNQGIELSWYGEAAADLRILGGVTVLDAKTQSGLDSTQNGANYLVLAAPRTFKVSLSVDL
jgi:outer membrane receptor for monomeric catechols